MKDYLPLIGAAVGAALGFLGAGLVRVLLDRRQELVRAQAFGRVIADELRRVERILEEVVESRDPQLAALTVPTEAWEAHRADIAGAVLESEFMALSQVSLALGTYNRAAANIAFQVDDYLQRGVPLPPLPEEHIHETQGVLLMVQQIAQPSVRWLAQGNLPLWRRRRARLALTPDPTVRCRCAHQWDEHRWEWRKRGFFRVRWRDHEVVCVAHECNVVGCGCRTFDRSDASRLTSPLRYALLLPQAAFQPLIAEAPEYDPSIPDSAQPGAEIDPESRDVRNAEVFGEGSTPLGVRPTRRRRIVARLAPIVVGAAVFVGGAVGRDLFDYFWPGVFEGIRGQEPVIASVAFDSRYYADGFQAALPGGSLPTGPINDCQSLLSAARAAGSADIQTTHVQVVLEGGTYRSVLIRSVKAVIVRRSAPLTGVRVFCNGGGELETIPLRIDLDRPVPLAETDGSRRLVSLARGEVAVLEVEATTRTSYVEWRLELGAVIDGRNQTIRLGVGDDPIRTTASAAPYRQSYRWAWEERPPRLIVRP